MDQARNLTCRSVDPKGEATDRVPSSLEQSSQGSIIVRVRYEPAEANLKVFQSLQTVLHRRSVCTRESSLKGTRCHPVPLTTEFQFAFETDSLGRTVLSHSKDSQHRIASSSASSELPILQYTHEPAKAPCCLLSICSLQPEGFHAP